MEASCASHCQLCDCEVQPGQLMWPWGRFADGRRCWVHMACAEAATPPELLPLRPPPCKHWRRRGTCLLGPRCFFAHPEVRATGTSRLDYVHLH